MLNRMDPVFPYMAAGALYVRPGMAQRHQTAPQSQASLPHDPPRPTAASTSSTSAKMSVVLCGYPSKICQNERAWKRDGSQHRFCEEHRARANVNQKRWAQRKARTKAMDKKLTTSSLDTEKKAYDVDESMLQAQAPMSFADFDMTLDSLLQDATFWSPTAASASTVHGKAQAFPSSSFSSDSRPWGYIEEQQLHQDDQMEAELWAALGLGNININMATI